MKTKILLLAILANSVSVIAADSASTNQPEGTPPRCEPGMKRKGPPPEIPGVSKEDMKKMHEAFMAAKDDPSLKELHAAVKAAHEKVKSATNKEDKKAAFEDLKKAHKAFMEAAKEVVLNANPELADTINKVSEFMKNRGPRKCPGYEKKESKEVKDDDELPPLPPPPAE
jgi:hypothetical protein